MVAEIVSPAGSPTTTPGRTCSRASPRPCSRRPAPSSALFEVDEAALPEVARRVRPRVVALGNLFRDQLDRYGELELVAERWRAGALDAAGDAAASSTPTIRSSRELATRARRRLADVRDRRPAARPAVAPACGRLDVLPRLRGAVRLRRGLRRPSRRLPLPRVRHARRPALDVAAREIELHGLDGSELTLDTPDGSSARSAGAAGALQRLQRDRGGRRRRSRSAPRLDEIAAGLEAFVAAFGRFERIAVGDKRLLMLLIKNPAGANEVGADAARRLSPTPGRRRPERRDRRRARRLLDLGRRLRAAARRARARRSSPAAGRPSSRCGSPTAASTAAGSRSSRRSRVRSTAGSS